LGLSLLIDWMPGLSNSFSDPMCLGTWRRRYHWKKQLNPQRVCLIFSFLLTKRQFWIVVSWPSLHVVLVLSVARRSSAAAPRHVLLLGRRQSAFRTSRGRSAESALRFERFSVEKYQGQHRDAVGAKIATPHNTSIQHSERSPVSGIPWGCRSPTG